MIEILKSKQKFTLLCYLSMIFIMFINNCNTSEYPAAPPPIPKRIDSPEELQKYLHKLHSYYVVVGRPRFGKRDKDSSSFLSLSDLIKAKLKPSRSQFKNNDYEKYINDFSKNEGPISSQESNELMDNYYD